MKIIIMGGVARCASAAARIPLAGPANRQERIVANNIYRQNGMVNLMQL